MPDSAGGGASNRQPMNPRAGTRPLRRPMRHPPRVRPPGPGPAPCAPCAPPPDHRNAPRERRTRRRFSRAAAEAASRAATRAACSGGRHLTARVTWTDRTNAAREGGGRRQRLRGERTPGSAGRHRRGDSRFHNREPLSALLREGGEQRPSCPRKRVSSASPPHTTENGLCRFTWGRGAEWGVVVSDGACSGSRSLAKDPGRGQDGESKDLGKGWRPDARNRARVGSLGLARDPARRPGEGPGRLAWPREVGALTTRGQLPP